MTKGLWVKRRTARSLGDYCQNTHDLGKINYYRSNQSRITRKQKLSLKTPSPHLSLLPLLKIHSQFSTSSPWAAQGDVHHKSLPLLPPEGEDSSHSSLPQRGSFPQGAVLQEQAAPAWVPHRVTSPDSKPAPAWAPLSMGSQVLPGACSSVDFPQGLSLLRASTCSGVGSSTGCR